MLIIKPANQANDLMGNKFGRWTPLEPVSRKGGSVYWKCQCDCGSLREVRSSTLNTGRSLSCGCLTRELTSVRQKARSTGNPARKRGTLEYFKCNTWNNIKKRTVNYNPDPRNKSYIKKGIELQMSKEEFYAWCDLNWEVIRTMKKPSIDRIDSNLHYSLDNIQVLEHLDNIKKSWRERG
jgi:hypothetical protein